MKRKFTIVLAVAMCAVLLLGLTACGGSSADKAYVAWAKDGIKRMEDAAAEYQQSAGATEDLEEKIALTEGYISVLRECEASLSEIDADELNETNKETYAQQMQTITEGIAGLESGIEQMQVQLGG